ncbi:hypothetical protein [Chitinophaga ginsengisoli]|uniref:Lipoprotein n=1 Tax=Chitinophaga ginsengisoli TaxID=363837 RepID=A0A2P8FVY0_9BACT|nr:hypothetical protein [Chitinophaga ginsengisoli]PSL25866.1 hypothetical protein CLV42_11271 [Chitinophaga ginsengisoli]
MKNHILFTVFFAIACYSCSTSKTTVQQGDPPKDAIQIAIEDFAEKCKLYQEDSIFRIKVWNYNQHKDFLIVSILGLRRKIILEPEDTIGSMGKSENRFYERDGKLFLWRDNNYPINREALGAFQRYNLIEMDSLKMKYPEYSRDDSQKAAVYFFCKNNLAIYKRVITNRGVGYFNPPILKCSEN